jgi:acid phosphatase (class A)
LYKHLPLAFILALALSACAASTPKEDHHAYKADHPIYFDYGSVDPSVIGPPPTAGLREDKADISVLESVEKKRTKEQCEAALAQAHPSADAFFPDNPFRGSERAEGIFWKVRSDASHVVDKIKSYYNRPRPFVRYPDKIHPCRPGKKGSSYPSGHATIASVLEQVLAQADPKHEAIYKQEMMTAGWNRIVAGVHHPSDVEAGNSLGKIIFQRLEQSPQFREDMDTLKGLAP